VKEAKGEMQEFKFKTKEVQLIWVYYPRSAEKLKAAFSHH